MTRQLPAGTCIRHAVNSVRNNIAYAFRISWPWYAVLIPAGIGAGLLADYVTGGNPEANPGALLPVYLILIVINLVAFASIAVNWHRYILLDEVPRGSELFRLDDKTWRYFGNVVLLFLILFAAALLFMVPVMILSSLSTITGILAIFAVLFALPFAAISFCRLSVKLPAIALGRRDFRLTDAWAVTKDNKQPIFFVVLFQFLMAVGITLALAVLLLGLIYISPALGVVVASIIQLVVGWIFTIFGITILTSLYGFFVEQRNF